MYHGNLFVDVNEGMYYAWIGLVIALVVIAAITVVIAIVISGKKKEEATDSDGVTSAYQRPPSCIEDVNSVTRRALWT